MALSNLIEELKKCDKLQDEAYSEYQDTVESFGETPLLVDYFKKKYDNAKAKKESLMLRIAEIEKQNLPNAFKRKRVEPQQPPSPFVFDIDINDEEPPMKKRPYNPRKEVVTSVAGLKYRNDPAFREKRRLYQKARREKLKLQADKN